MNTTSQLFDLTDKTAIVTGAGGLLGGQHAIALAEMGANVVLTDLETSLENCRNLNEELLKKDIAQDKIMIMALNVTDQENWKNLAAETIKRFGRIDILVNNAGFTNASKTENFKKDFFNFPLQDWNGILNVNLTGTFLGCQIIGKIMCEQKSGSIINLASLYGVGSPNHTIYEGTDICQPPAYTCSKFGVVGLTKYCGTLFAKDKVRVNALTPSGIFDNHGEQFVERFSHLNPMKRMADKTEMRGALIYLASEASSHCTGHNLIVDGGWTAW